MTERSDIVLWVSDGSTERALSRPIEVGSHSRSDFKISGPGVLQQHLRFMPDPRGARLLPAPGAAFMINGVSRNTPLGLMPGDRISIGGIVLKVFAANATEDSEQPWSLVSSETATITCLSRELRIGRDAASDICLPDIHASRHHAHLVLRAGCAWIRDLGSRNGSFVNGDRVHGATRLLSGDELRLDRAEFKIFGPGTSFADKTHEEHHFSAKSVPTHPGAVFSTGAPMKSITALERGAGRLRPGLYLVESTMTGSGGWHRLLSGRTLIGRTGDCDLRLQDRSVSAHHCEIQRGPGGVFVRDLGSSNGTRINERRIRTASIREGDRITIGRVQLSLREIRSGHRTGGWLRWLRRLRHPD